MNKGKMIFRVIGAVFLLLIVAVMGYVFMPFLALLIVSMQSVTAVLFELVILLTFLTLVKMLIQILTGKKIQIKFLQKLKNKLTTLKKKNVPTEDH